MIRLLTDWWEALIRPGTVSARLLADRPAAERRAMVGQLFLPFIAIMLVLQIPFLRLIGIGWTDVYVFPAILLLSLLYALLSAATIHIGLRLVGIRSRLDDILTLYIVRIGLPSSLLALLSYPVIGRMADAMKTARSHHLSPGRGAGLIFASITAANRSTSPSWPEQLLSVLPQLLSMVILYGFARAVVAHYRSDRFQTYSGIGLGTYVVFVAPMLLLLTLHYLLLYTAVPV